MATLFATGDVARWCSVDPKTITGWVAAGRLQAGRTPGGHLRFHPLVVRRLLEQMGADVPAIVERACEAASKTPEAAS